MKCYQLKGKSLFLSSYLLPEGILGTPLLNKGCAFSLEERENLELVGYLPQQVETLDQQIDRHYQQYQQLQTDLSRSIYLSALQNTNEVLFYGLVSQHVEQMLPIIYTPTVGMAVEEFSTQFRKTRGLYVSYKDRHRLQSMLQSAIDSNTQLVVVTDGGSVLGIGDQGLGGMAISIGKLMVYTLLGGINPYEVLPIQLDVGTDNQKLLADPHYLGERHERITGSEYEGFVDEFFKTLHAVAPQAFIHCEDFARGPATQILARYRNQYSLFNDDIQGTGAVTLACVWAGLRRAGQARLSDQRIVILGAGAAGLGIADQLVDAMGQEGTSAQEARQQVWLLNSRGLLTQDMGHLDEFQQKYVRSLMETQEWMRDEQGHIGLLEVVTRVKPSILIGCSTSLNAFTEQIIKMMHHNTPRPIILPLSNPKTRVEAIPEDLLRWTQGQALVATGSPFEPVTVNGIVHQISQCNNGFIYPGIGLAMTSCRIRHLTDELLLAASSALGDYALDHPEEGSSLLPPLHLFPHYSQKIALAVAEKARGLGLLGIPENTDLQSLITAQTWIPHYYTIQKASSC